MNRDYLIKALNISLGDTDKVVTEKLFCAALLTLSTTEVQRVTTEYNRLRNILRGNGDSALQK